MVYGPDFMVRLVLKDISHSWRPWLHLASSSMRVAWSISAHGQGVGSRYQAFKGCWFWGCWVVLLGFEGSLKSFWSALRPCEGQVVVPYVAVRL